MVNSTATEVQMHAVIYNEFTRNMFICQTAVEVEALILIGIILIFKAYLPFISSRILTHRPVVGILTRARNIVPLGGFQLRNGMYRKDLGDTTMYFVKKYVGSFFIAGVPYDTVHKDQAHVQDPLMNRFVYTLREMGYNNIRRVKEAVSFAALDPEDCSTPILDEETKEILVPSVLDQLGYSSYDEARKDMNPSGLTAHTEIYAPRFSNVPQDILLKFGYAIAPGGVNAQIMDTIEFNQQPIPEDKLRDIMPYLLLIICIAIGIAIVASTIR